MLRKQEARQKHLCNTAVMSQTDSSLTQNTIIEKKNYIAIEQCTDIWHQNTVEDMQSNSALQHQTLMIWYHGNWPASGGPW